MTATPVIHTDIGTDVDDLLALALALRSPELELVAITCAYGNVDLRARIAARLLTLYGDRPLGGYRSRTAPGKPLSLGCSAGRHGWVHDRLRTGQVLGEAGR